jgi:hypothetical protein
MPAATQAEQVIFGLQQSFAALEAGIAVTPELQQTADAITQLRAIAALGLGIDLEADLFSLFDREAALSIAGIDADLQPGGQLLLRPSDPEAAAQSLARMSDALVARGAAVTTEVEGGVTITTLSVPTVVELAYAVRDGVIVVAFQAADVAAAMRANLDGTSLADGARYRAAWELAGAQAGNELFVDVGAIVDALGDQIGVTGAERDILLEVGAFAVTAPSAADHGEFYVVLSAR